MFIDTFGQSSVFGKNIGGDILNNKKTWLLVETFKRVNPQQRERLNYLLSLTAESADEKIKGVQDLYVEAGIKQAAEEAIAGYHKKALAALDTVEFTPAQRNQLEIYADNLINRNK